MAVGKVSDADFDSEVLKATGAVVVDFWAEWCGPCRRLAPTVDALATEYDGRVTVAKMNVDENPNVPGRFMIRGIPTMLIFKNGQLAGQLRDVAYQATTTEFWNSMEAIGGPQTYVLGGAFNCGKGQPGQVAPVSHGAPSALFRGVNILNAVKEAGK